MAVPSTHPIASRGFTLIELLVVISIMGILSGMLSSIVAIAQQRSKQTKTRATMMKVDHATRMFRTEMGIYPLQTDLATADVDPDLWTNQLGFRLAWAPADADERRDYLRGMQEDLDTIHARFVFHDGRRIGLLNGDGTHAYRVLEQGGLIGTTNIAMGSRSQIKTDMGFLSAASEDNGDPLNTGGIRRAGQSTGTGIVLTRMASEITVLKYLAGQLPVEAPTGLDPSDPVDRARCPDLDVRHTSLGGSPYRPYNKGTDARGPVLTAAAAKAQGWRGDYLAGDLKRQSAPGMPGEIDVTGTTILDAWGNPLVYVCPVVPGARGYVYMLGGSAADESLYGLTPHGRTLTTTRASDIRTTAAEPYLLEFELWSKGRDGRFAELRDASVNGDNIALHGYHRGLE